MNEASYAYLIKTVFWQRFSMIVLAIFLAVMWFASAYYFMDFMEHRSYSHAFKREEFYMFLILFAYLSVGIYVDVLLFQASRALDAYLKTDDMVQLEISFRKQRHFWMTLSLMVLSVVGVIFFFVFAVSTFR